MKSALLMGAISLVVGGAAGLFGGAYAMRAYKPEPIQVVERADTLNTIDVDETPYVFISLPASQSGNYSAIAGLYFYSSSL